MAFHALDIEKWDRSEYFKHYLNDISCSYSSTVNMDISNLRGYKLYPVMIWLLTKTVNAIEQFRTAFQGNLVGIYDSLHPSFTIFNDETKHFSSVWTSSRIIFQNFTAIICRLQRNTGIPIVLRRKIIFLKTRSIFR